MSRPLFEIQGFDELSQRLKKFPDKIKKREVLKLLRAAARSTVKAARDEAPVSKKPHSLKGGKVIKPGNLKKSIGVQTARRAKNPMVVVRPRSSGTYDGFYGRAFVIFGHNVYRTGFKRNRKGNKGYNAGGAKSSVPANPFMNRAYQKTDGKVDADAVKRMETYIQKQISRL